MLLAVTSLAQLSTRPHKSPGYSDVEGGKPVVGHRGPFERVPLVVWILLPFLRGHPLYIVHAFCGVFFIRFFLHLPDLCYLCTYSDLYTNVDTRAHT